jgi:hypothetical protein
MNVEAATVYGTSLVEGFVEHNTRKRLIHTVVALAASREAHDERDLQRLIVSCGPDLSWNLLEPAGSSIHKEMCVLVSGQGMGGGVCCLMFAGYLFTVKSSLVECIVRVANSLVKVSHLTRSKTITITTQTQLRCWPSSIHQVHQARRGWGQVKLAVMGSLPLQLLSPAEPASQRRPAAPQPRLPCAS